MFTVNFPYDIGTKVKTPDGAIGSISCYQAVDGTEIDDDDYIVMVSGIKQTWCGEYLLSDLKIMDKTSWCDEIAEIIMTEKEMIKHGIETNDRALISLTIENLLGE